MTRMSTSPAAGTGVEDLLDLQDLGSAWLGDDDRAHLSFPSMEANL
jgi:hypothetical protein